LKVGISMPKRKKKNNPFFSTTMPDPTAQARSKSVQNMAQIQGLLKTLSTQVPLFPLSVKNADDPENLVLEKEGARVFLLSHFDRENELKNMFANVDPEIEFLILFGIGNGQAIEYAKQHFPNLERVVVVEPSVQVLKAALRRNPVVQRIAKAGTVTFMYNKSPEDTAQSLAQNIQENIRKKYGAVFYVSYRTLFPGYYEKMMELLVLQVRQTASNMVVVEHNMFLKTQNVLNNLPVPSLDIEELLSMLRGKPAIMVSAGPSLNKNMHLLEEAKKKCFVVAVGSAVKILHSNGILPHVRAAFSPYPDENVVFDGIDDFQGVPLVFSNTLDFMVVKKYDAPKFRMVMAGDPISRFVYTRSGVKHALVGGGGTIANVTFDLLCRAGCSKVILMGQDLCYTDNNLYAKGSWSNPVVSQGAAGLLPEKDIFGNRVFTSKAFLGLRHDFEQAMKAYAKQGTQFLNATEGGLHLEGSQDLPLEDVLDAITQEVDFGTLIHKAFEQASTIESAEKVEKELDKVLDGLASILEINEQRRQALQQVLGQEDVALPNVYRQLQEVEKFEGKLMAIPVYAQVLMPELRSQLFAVKTSHQYKGNDVGEKAKSLSNTLIGYTGKVLEYARFFHETVSRVLQKGVK